MLKSKLSQKMKDSEKDKLEQFFQNSLEHYQEQPADDAWEKMERSIPPPPAAPVRFSGKNKTWLGLFLIIGMLFLIAVGFWGNSQQLNEIKMSVDLQDEKIKAMASERLQKTIQAEEDFLRKNEDTSIKETQESEGIGKLSNSIFAKKQLGTIGGDLLIETDFGKRDNRSTEKLSNKFLNENINSNIDLLKEDNPTEFLNTKSESVEAVKSSQKISAENRTFETLDSIESLFSEAILAERKPIENFTIIGLEKELPKRGFELFGNISKIFPRQKIINSGVSFENQQNDNVDIGLLYHIPFNQNWSLQFGIGMGRTVHSSIIPKAFEYASNEVTLGDDLLQTNYYYQLENNYDGKIGVTTYFDNQKQNDGQDVLPGDYFSTEIILSRKQDYLVVPLLLKYTHGNENRRLRWTMKTGIFERIYFKKGNYNSIEIKNISSTRLSHNQTQFEIIEGVKSNRKMEMEFVLGTGIEYAPNQNFTIVLEPIFKKAITLQEQIEPATFGIYTGLRWNFTKK